MNPGPLRPASLVRDASGTPFSAEFGDVYHPRSGALAQARHVFVAGHGLPGRWRGRDRFVVLETGFGLGHNFLATWDAWRSDPQRCARLDFVSIEDAPLGAADLADAHAGSPLPDLAAQLVAAWPPRTPDLHLLDFDRGRVRLLLALGDVGRWLPQLAARVDAFDLDGFAPAKNPRMWEPRVFKAMARLAAPDATAATWSAARPVRDGLEAAGFEVEASAGQGGKRDITLARYAPHFLPRGPATGTAARTAHGPQHAVVVGAGLAGCAAALALAEAGWTTRVLDRHDRPATEASGNPAGLFHGVVHGQDGAHARFGRAAAFEARRAVARAIAEYGVDGATTGVLRLATDGTSYDRMQALVQRLGLPADCVRAVDAAQASAIAGIALAHPAWFHAAGGWVDPAGLARSFLARAGAAAEFEGGVMVERLVPADGGWALLDGGGAAIAQAAHVVFANAADAWRLLAPIDWPLRTIRGQVSWLEREAAGSRPLPRVPVAGSGYLLAGADGRILFGATSDDADADAQVRATDHARNAAQLAALSPDWAAIDLGSLQGRVGWRCTPADRMPLIGPVPDPQIAPARPDQPRFAARRTGLYVFVGLGSRGITSAPLGAQVLAAWVTGAPMPVQASLRDALDPARFAVRRWRAARRGG